MTGRNPASKADDETGTGAAAASRGAAEGRGAADARGAADPRGPTAAGGSAEPRALLDALEQKAAAEVHVGRALPGSRLEQVVVGGLALAALALCSYNVVVRYFVPSLVLEWSDEVQVYLVIWAIFLALGLVTAADRHVKADLLVGLFSARAQRLLLLSADVLGLAFAVFLVAYGAAVAWQTYDYGDVSTTSLRFPLWIYTAALPAGGLLMGVHYALRLARPLRRKR
jgi:C4-dicarboxylate transporter DctQ subunit